jgi:hypothetical protein
MERDEFGRPKDVACRDTNPGAFHVAVVGLLERGAASLSDNQQRRLPFIIDHNYDWEVWNFPVVRFQVVEEEEVTEAQAQDLVANAGSDYQFNTQARRFIRTKVTYWMISDGVSASAMLEQAEQRGVEAQATDLNYLLELNTSGRILGGEWITEPEVSFGEDSRKLHPDFMWMAVKHRGSGEDSDDLGGDDDNPYVAYSKARALLDCANDAATCAPAGGGGSAPVPGPCAGMCGGQASGCWCDDGCTQYGDCCANLCTDCATLGHCGGGTPGGGGSGTTGAGTWSCNPSYNGTADGCDCGCATADPDCAGGGCTTPGCGASGCNYCYDAMGNSISCP